MKKILAFHTILWLFTTVSAIAQDTKPLDKSIFWEVTGKGKTKMYILGTHHLYPNDFLKKNEAIKKAFKKADIVVGEIVIDTNMLRMGMKMMSYVYMKNNSLKKLLSPEDYALVDEYARKNIGMSIEPMNTMKPIMLYQMLLAKKYTATTGKATTENIQNLDNTIDGYVQKEGLRKKKKVYGLEEIDDQMKVLYDGYTLERQAEMLVELVKNKDTGSDTEILQMDKMYAEQDIEQLFQFTQKEATESETDMLLTNRNNKWMPQLEQMLQGKKHVFVAVGAGHLAGKVGILTQLRAKGYQITPIKIVLE